jgi:hypothetical protein
MIRPNAAHCGNTSDSHEPAESPLLRDVISRLGKSPYLPLRKLVCRLDGDQLLLQGRVPTFHLKQVLWNLLREVVDPSRIVDRVEVVVPGKRRA